ncbi:MAG TPA: right-handed parallel beta-helix repeat-containing protein [Candidatus Limnocylindrales bacterium]|nr:right-handed parallel beta-helix repeat-containing protein [Candidatus Limnocylindrales bacterium]
MRNAVVLTKLLFLLLGIGRIQAMAATLYVAIQGSDSNPGSSVQPLRTVTRAYNLAKPGDTILVKPGVYTDYSRGWGLHLGKSGSASSPIVLRAQPRGGAVLDGRNAADRNVGIYIDGNYNVVDGFEIRNGTKGGITIWGNENQILHCNIHHNGNPASTSTEGKDGIYSNEGTSGNVYIANRIYHNGRPGSNLDHGLYLCGQYELVLNNVLVANSACGLQIAGYSTVSNLKVYNNVMAFNGTDGIILWQSLNGIEIRNNIFYKNGHYAIGSYDAHGTGIIVDRNLSFGNGYRDFNFTDGGSDYSHYLGSTIPLDPRFVNAAATGFDPHLATGSPAIKAALNLASIFTTDKAGTARPLSGAWDLGVYVY